MSPTFIISVMATMIKYKYSYTNNLHSFKRHLLQHLSFSHCFYPVLLYAIFLEIYIYHYTLLLYMIYYNMCIKISGERTGAMQTGASVRARLSYGIFGSAMIVHVYRIAVGIVPLAASASTTFAMTVVTIAATASHLLWNATYDVGMTIMKLMLTKDFMRTLIPR